VSKGRRLNPGANFGAYGIAKAALLALDCASTPLEGGGEGIRCQRDSNADRIRSGLLDDAMIQARATAGVSTAHHLHGGNLLGQEVPPATWRGLRLPWRLGAHHRPSAVLTVDGAVFWGGGPGGGWCG